MLAEEANPPTPVSGEPSETGAGGSRRTERKGPRKGPCEGPRSARPKEEGAPAREFRESRTSTRQGSKKGPSAPAPREAKDRGRRLGKALEGLERSLFRHGGGHGGGHRIESPAGSSPRDKAGHRQGSGDSRKEKPFRVTARNTGRPGILAGWEGSLVVCMAVSRAAGSSLPSPHREYIARCA